MRGGQILICALLLGALSGCSMIFSSLDIVNRGASEARHVVLSARGVQFADFGDIPPGETRSLYRYVSGDGVMNLSFSSKGRRLTFETCYYTGWMPAEGEIVILNDKVVANC